MIEFTDWATEIIEKADAAARRLNPDARVRLALATAAPGDLRGGPPAVSAGPTLEARLTDAVEEGDVETAVGRALILVDRRVAGLVDVEEPHDRLVLRPAGSAPNERAH